MTQRLALWCIGFGLWALTPRAKRKALWDTRLVHIGRNAVLALNAAATRDELARRHAKPSTRKRIA